MPSQRFRMRLLSRFLPWVSRKNAGNGGHAGFCVAFPKSGRTWLQFMLDECGVPLKYTHNGARHSKPVPFEALRLCGERYRDKRVVFLSRDPRDTAVSGYFQKHLRRGGYAGTISDFIRDPLHGVEKIVRFNVTWLERGPRLCDFLPITYEALSAQPVDLLQTIVTFVGFGLSDEDLARAVANNTFDNMQRREIAGDGRSLTRRDVDNPESYKIRRGKVGGYVDYLSAGDISFCQEILDRYRYFETLSHSKLATHDSISHT